MLKPLLLRGSIDLKAIKFFVDVAGIRGEETK